MPIPRLLSYSNVTCEAVIEHLSTHGWITECFLIDSVPRDLPKLLIHLKYFYMESMSFASADELRFLAILIKSSPNLEKIRLDIDTDYVYDGLVSVIRESYSHTWLEHLNELEIQNFDNSKSGVEFVKFILAKSPKLKKVDLEFDVWLDENEESELLRTLSHSHPPASTVVEIIFRGLRDY